MKQGIFLKWTLLLILSSSFAFSSDTPPEENLELKKEVASSAYRLAVSLAKARNAQMTCETEAYESTILEVLTIAVNNSDFIKNDAKSNPELLTALSSNLVFHEMLGLTETAEGFAQAFAQSKWESVGGGVQGPERQLVFKGDNQVEMISLRWNEKEEPVWTHTQGRYELSGTEEERMVTLDFNQENAIHQEIKLYHLIKFYKHGTAYRLQNINEDQEDHYFNEPSDCGV